MSYTTTITFPVQTINSNVTPTETIQLILEFTHNESGSNRSWTSDEKNLRVLNYGKREMSYDLEDAFMVPGKTSLVIGDPDGVLDDLLFGAGATALATDKQAKVTKKINGSTEFVGNMIEDSIEFDDAAMTVKFDAAPKTDILNKKMIYDSSNNYLDPARIFKYQYQFIGVSPTTFPSVGDIYSNNGSSYEVLEDYNPSFPTYLITGRLAGDTDPILDPESPSGTLTRVSGSGDTSITYTSFVVPEVLDYLSLTSILEHIFGVVNPAIEYPSTLKITHGWQFQGKRDSDACYLNVIELSEIYQSVNEIFYNTASGLNNLGDVLKKLAIDWCSFTGMISYSKAFFKQLFYYDSNNLQTVSVLKRIKGYRYGLIDYVKVTTLMAAASDKEPYQEGIFTQLEGRTIERSSLPGFFINGVGTSSGSNIKASVSRSNIYVFDHGSTIAPHPDEGSVYSNNGSYFEVIGTPYDDGSVSIRLTTKKTYGTNEPEAAGTLVWESGYGPSTITFTSVGNADGIYTINQARDSNLFNGNMNDHGALLAKFWINWRGNIQNCRVDKFILRGISYDFLKDFNYMGSKYQTIAMIYQDSIGVTECEAIYLGEV